MRAALADPGKKPFLPTHTLPLNQSHFHFPRSSVNMLAPLISGTKEILARFGKNMELSLVHFYSSRT